jgi:hypothetical protein
MDDPLASNLEDSFGRRQKMISSAVAMSEGRSVALPNEIPLERCLFQRALMSSGEGVAINSNPKVGWASISLPFGDYSRAIGNYTRPACR